MRMTKGAEKAKRRPHTVDTVIACNMIVILALFITIAININLSLIMTIIMMIVNRFLINDNLIKTNKAKQGVKDEQPAFCLVLRRRKSENLFCKWELLVLQFHNLPSVSSISQLKTQLKTESWSDLGGGEQVYIYLYSLFLRTNQLLRKVGPTNGNFLSESSDSEK